jgi:hypothetical protein
LSRSSSIFYRITFCDELEKEEIKQEEEEERKRRRNILLDLDNRCEKVIL